jgi:hypothetical protein
VDQIALGTVEDEIDDIDDIDGAWLLRAGSVRRDNTSVLL